MTNQPITQPSGSAAEPPRVLHLTLHRRWFDAIAARTKTFEYRKIKPYWTKRLAGKSYDEIHFRNGYNKDAPFMRVEWVGLTIGTWDDDDVYAIQLGDILEIRNYEAPKAPQGRGEPLGEPFKSSPSQAPEASA